MHPIPLKHATKISLQQNFSLLMTLSFFIKSLSLSFLYWSWCSKLLLVPTLTLFVPTLTPLFGPLYFTQKVFFQNSKHLRQFFIVLGYTHMRYIAKMVIDIRDKNFYKTCDWIVNFTQFNMCWIRNICRMSLLNLDFDIFLLLHIYTSYYIKITYNIITFIFHWHVMLLFAPGLRMNQS